MSRRRNSKTSQTDPATVYAGEVYFEAQRCAKRRNAQDASDIAGTVFEKFAQNPNHYMTIYPDPYRYARAAVRNAAISYGRTQGAQRGEGARFTYNADGTTSPGRLVLSGNALTGEGLSELFDTVACQDEPFEDQIDRQIDNKAMLDQSFIGRSDRALQMMWMVDAEGFTVKEAASQFGLARETGSREINQTRMQVHQNILAFQQRELAMSL